MSDGIEWPCSDCGESTWPCACPCVDGRCVTAKVNLEAENAKLRAALDGVHTLLLDKDVSRFDITNILADFLTDLAPSPKPPEAAPRVTPEDFAHLEAGLRDSERGANRSAEIERELFPEARDVLPVLEEFLGNHLTCHVEDDCSDWVSLSAVRKLHSALTTPKAEAAREGKDEGSTQLKSARFIAYGMEHHANCTSDTKYPSECRCGLSQLHAALSNAPPPMDEACPRCAELERALDGVLWMAEKWAEPEHAGHPTWEAIESARAALANGGGK